MPVNCICISLVSYLFSDNNKGGASFRASVTSRCIFKVIHIAKVMHGQNTTMGELISLYNL